MNDTNISGIIQCLICTEYGICMCYNIYIYKDSTYTRTKRLVLNMTEIVFIIVGSITDFHRLKLNEI